MKPTELETFTAIANEILAGALGPPQRKIREFYKCNGPASRRQHLRIIQRLIDRVKPGLYAKLEPRLILAGNSGVQEYERLHARTTNKPTKKVVVSL